MASATEKLFSDCKVSLSIFCAGMTSLYDLAVTTTSSNCWMLSSLLCAHKGVFPPMQIARNSRISKDRCLLHLQYIIRVVCLIFKYLGLLVFEFVSFISCLLCIG